MNILQYILHLWAVPPMGLSLSCPPAAEGQTTNPVGYFDDQSVIAAFSSVAALSSILVIVAIAICYLATRKSTGPRFDRRWFIWLVASGVVSAGVAYLLLTFRAHTFAAAGTCESNPNQFPVELPTSIVMSRTIAGLLWGPLAFTVLSMLFTLVFGAWPSLKNGFYHNRGTPWPRLLKPGGR